jgi:hypothetical protein
MRTYQAVTGEPPVFHEFFRTFLLPVQFRHRARLGGRWETEDGLVVAIWEYDDRAAYERIEADVRADPDSHRAQEHRRQLPALMTATNETFMSPTIESVPAAMRYLASAGSAAGTETRARWSGSGSVAASRACCTRCPRALAERRSQSVVGAPVADAQVAAVRRVRWLAPLRDWAVPMQKFCAAMLVMRLPGGVAVCCSGRCLLSSPCCTAPGA